MATKAAKKTENGVVNRIADVSSLATGKTEIVTFRVVGISPLLQNNPTNFIGQQESSSLGVKKVYNDEEEARLRVYQNEEGLYYHPSQSFHRSMVRAVTGKKFGKVSAPGILKGNIFLAEPHSIILDADGEPATSYAIDRQPCVVNKAKILRCRPVWKIWQMDVAFDVDATFLPFDSLKQWVFEALATAGRTVGVGDYRPEKGGGFGRFVVQ
jgi:hypothetical protein